MKAQLSMAVWRRMARGPVDSRAAWAVAFAFLLLAGGAARCATTDGTMITNVASASFQTSGSFRVIVSYAVSAYVLVQNPAIQLVKTSSVTMQASGGDVVFRICVRNTSAAVSSFNVTLTDQLPSNMTYVNPSFANWVVGTGTWTAASAPAIGGPWTNGEPGNGQVPPYFMKWTLSVLGPNASGCVSYTARVM
jgi:uncharacterized repeat protein (TIGR01451 family)